MSNIVRNSSIIILLTFIFAASSGYDFQELTVKSLSAVFRHGDRVPDGIIYSKIVPIVYPSDPYQNHSFYPEGRGALTKLGKKRAYSLGKYLRSAYKNFLGDIYIPSEVYARSSNFNRAKMTLQLVMAGLYQASNSRQRWDNYLNWQPTVSANSLPENLDSMMIPFLCSRYLKLFKDVQTLPDVERRQIKFKSLMENLSNLTGASITSSFHMLVLHGTLTAQKYMKLELPRWAYSTLSDDLFQEGAALSYELQSYNLEMKRFNGGPFLKQIIRNMNKVVEGKSGGRKLILLSGHETNVAGLLSVLGVFQPHVPDYASAVIIELLADDDDVHYVRIKYYNGVFKNTKILQIPGCEHLCPLDQFIKLTQKFIPSDEQEMNCFNTNPEKLSQIIYDNYISIN